MSGGGVQAWEPDVAFAVMVDLGYRAGGVDLLT